MFSNDEHAILTEFNN